MDLKERMELLSELVQHPGWEVLRDHMNGVREAAMMALASPKRKLPDDFYRGNIDVAAWVSFGLERELKKYFEELSQPPTAEGQPLGNPYESLEPVGQPAERGAE